MKTDRTVNMICTRTDGTNDLDVCYFNNTRCDQIYHKIEPIKFVFD